MATILTACLLPPLGRILRRCQDNKTDLDSDLMSDKERH
ncbi:hypothetical protein T4B_748 [Trichinella pseudospiralis]|uniref:Uncharacterized protein n=1 Tax=Trichinella pseudospiralis TaxID=6337 RepID=A0A0V1GI54_TRIPS|nr:hypothetical protein T4B_748 [Trichinella pseudospiralis]